MTLFYQGELDVLFGFREHLPIKNEILFTELRQVPLCCVLPQNHPYGEKDSIRVEDLFTESLVACNSYTIPAQAVELQNLVAQHITPENIYVSENPQVALALVRAGYGCCILPQSPDTRDGLLYRPLQGGRNSSVISAPCITPLKKSISSFMMLFSHMGGFLPGWPYWMAPSISVLW